MSSGTSRICTILDMLKAYKHAQHMFSMVTFSIDFMELQIMHITLGVYQSPIRSRPEFIRSFSKSAIE
jgi:hypothetical protein